MRGYGDGCRQCGKDQQKGYGSAAWQKGANKVRRLALLADLTPRQRALSSRPIRREQPTTSTAMIAANLRCSRPRDLSLQQSVEGSGLLGNDRLGRSRDQQTASESGSESSAKIDPMDCREDRLFPAGLGDIEKTIHPREVLEVFGPEAGKVEGQVLAPVFLEVTDEIFGYVYLS